MFSPFEEALQWSWVYHMTERTLVINLPGPDQGELGPVMTEFGPSIRWKGQALILLPDGEIDGVHIDYDLPSRCSYPKRFGGPCIYFMRPRFCSAHALFFCEHLVA